MVRRDRRPRRKDGSEIEAELRNGTFALASKDMERKLVRPREIDEMLLMRDRGDDLADFGNRKRPAAPHQVGKAILRLPSTSLQSWQMTVREKRRSNWRS
jgi:hypothetical protein